MVTAVVGKSFVDELLKNNVTLQQVSVELITAVKQMTERTDRLLALFEEAAKNIEKAEVKEPLAKQLEMLLEQNKVIARGLVLLEKYIRDKTSLGMRASLEPSKPLPKY